MKRNMCAFNANIILEQNDEDCNVIRLQNTSLYLFYRNIQLREWNDVKDSMCFQNKSMCACASFHKYTAFQY